jgi:hypothetical protein
MTELWFYLSSTFFCLAFDNDTVTLSSHVIESSSPYKIHAGLRTTVLLCTDRGPSVLSCGGTISHECNNDIGDRYIIVYLSLRCQNNGLPLLTIQHLDMEINSDGELQDSAREY